MVNTAAEKLYIARTGMIQIDDTRIEEAKEKFEAFKKAGVIGECRFEDNKWLLTDEYSRMNMRFYVNPFTYKRFYENVFGTDLNTFIDYMKVYVITAMGENALGSLVNIVRDIKHVVRTNFKEREAFDDMISLKMPARTKEFFRKLPEPTNEEEYRVLLGEIDRIIEYQDDFYSSEPRELASFDTYLLFNDILNDFWKADITEDERLFFYPLYLWWKITAVIPLRPREFILTPRRCLEKKKDGWYLTLRRNKIKGSGRSITYKIEGDYITVQYKIPDGLAAEIQTYLNYTAKYESTQLHTLFITDTHYKHWERRKSKVNRYFTYTNMNCVLRYFYNDVIVGKYHLNVVDDRTLKHLNRGEIQRLHLGDTRHLALINIIAEGGTPVLAMMLAGHDDINMASHYYSNITSLIECRTYAQYRKVLQGEVIYTLSGAECLPAEALSYIGLCDGNRCYSEKYINRDYSDCRKVIGPKGEIAYCPSCKYYRKSCTEDYFKDDEVYKRNILDDCKHLEKVVNLARRMNGNSEDIMQAFLRIKSDAYDYEQFLKEKAERGIK